MEEGFPEIITISAHAEEILNEDHYGLEKVKERILEYLAVRTLSKERKWADPVSGRSSWNRQDFHCPFCGQSIK